MLQRHQALLPPPCGEGVSAADGWGVAHQPAKALDDLHPTPALPIKGREVARVRVFLVLPRVRSVGSSLTLRAGRRPCEPEGLGTQIRSSSRFVIPAQAGTQSREAPRPVMPGSRIKSGMTKEENWKTGVSPRSRGECP